MAVLVPGALRKHSVNRGAMPIASMWLWRQETPLLKEIDISTISGLSEQEAFARLKELRLYDLRHFHVSVMLQQRQSPALASQRLGHASVSTTMDIYSHILPGWPKEAANAFAKAMGEG